MGNSIKSANDDGIVAECAIAKRTCSAKCAALFDATGSRRGSLLQRKLRNTCDQLLDRIRQLE
jgi:hypothetical protein